jgi:hypothetical protein
MCIAIEKNTQGRKNTEKIWQIKKFDIILWYEKETSLYSTNRGVKQD